jgi:PPOX class probable FMN-dependent enzyme
LIVEYELAGNGLWLKRMNAGNKQHKFIKQYEIGVFQQLPDCLVCKCRLIHTCTGTYSFVAESGRRFAMTDLEGSFVTNIDSLAAHYAKPTERLLKKRLDHVNAVGRAFIAASPFLVLATGSREGLDCSPKGDRPGFVEVADDGRTLLIPDRRGNNLIDGLRNLVEDSRIGLIFFVPGVNETYRVNGRARISSDADLRHRFAVNGKEPTTVMVVTVEQAFAHCPKALVRSDLWKAASAGRPKGVPTLGDFVAARDPGINSAAFDAAYSQRIPKELY